MDITCPCCATLMYPTNAIGSGRYPRDARLRRVNIDVRMWRIGEGHQPTEQEVEEEMQFIRGILSSSALTDMFAEPDFSDAGRERARMEISMLHAVDMTTRGDSPPPPVPPRGSSLPSYRDH